MTKFQFHRPTLIPALGLPTLPSVQKADFFHADGPLPIGDLRRCGALLTSEGPWPSVLTETV
jgi:hypothetical protein